MSMKAVGAYLRELRDARAITREQLIGVVGGSVSNIQRIEAGEQEVKAATLARLIAAVNGDADDVQALLLQADASAADGVVMARRRLAQTWGGQAVSEPLDAATREEVAILEALQAELMARPYIFELLETLLRVVRRGPAGGDTVIDGGGSQGL